MMRKRSAVVSLLVALTFALSILAAARPAGLPGEGTLLADLAETICRPGQEAPGKGSLPQHEPCCILCAAAMPPVNGPAGAAGVALRRQPDAGFRLASIYFLPEPRPALRLTALIPRAPPNV